ncbi:PRC-barrel domain-containing protein [Sedimenticola sp.]|uniref:PRC-barrel domain-containing protein n=1 Tax=Sedimenticola sp. TaxID=1940285 RepID=UPI003D0FD8E8
MKKVTRQSILAGAVAALITLPGWSAEGQPPVLDSTDTTATQPAPELKTDLPENSPVMESPVTAESQLAATHPMLALTPDDLYRQEVIGSDGKTIGRVTDIVSDKANGDIYAVVSTGGFLGIIGGTKHIVSIDELSFEDKALHIRATQEGLATHEKYQEGNYLVVKPDDHPISEFSAFEKGK